MNYIVEASPEILFALLLFGIITMLFRGRVSARTLRSFVAVYAGGLIVVMMLLYQSNTQTINTLKVQENYAKTDSELADVKDLSPKTLSSEESSERLNELIETQKASVSDDDSND